jgi:hypothetical protein
LITGGAKQKLESPGRDGAKKAYCKWPILLGKAMKYTTNNQPREGYLWHSLLKPGSVWKWSTFRILAKSLFKWGGVKEGNLRSLITKERAGLKQYPLTDLTIYLRPWSTHLTLTATGFCPGFSECRVFSAGMKIVIDKNLENTVW